MTYKENAEEIAMKILMGSVTRENVLGSKKAKRIESLSELPTKVAIVLLGASGAGKTTFANQYASENDDVVVVGMDECVDEVCEKNKSIFQFDIEERAMELFSDLLDKYVNEKKTILIDGLWIATYGRGILFKTLREYGYKICVLYVKFPSDAMLTRFTKRAEERAEILLSKSINVSKSQKKKVVESELSKQFFQMHAEVTSILRQQDSGLLYQGADYFLEM